jgi:hypothetical protein
MDPALRMAVLHYEIDPRGVAEKIRRFQGQFPQGEPVLATVHTKIEADNPFGPKDRWQRFHSVRLGVITTGLELDPVRDILRLPMATHVEYELGKGGLNIEMEPPARNEGSWAEREGPIEVEGDCLTQMVAPAVFTSVNQLERFYGWMPNAAYMLLSVGKEEIVSGLHSAGALRENLFAGLALQGIFWEPDKDSLEGQLRQIESLKKEEIRAISRLQQQIREGGLKGNPGLAFAVSRFPGNYSSVYDYLRTLQMQIAGSEGEIVASWNYYDRQLSMNLDDAQTFAPRFPLTIHELRYMTIGVIAGKLEFNPKTGEICIPTKEMVGISPPGQWEHYSGKPTRIRLASLSSLVNGALDNDWGRDHHELCIGEDSMESRLQGLHEIRETYRAGWEILTAARS